MGVASVSLSRAPSPPEFGGTCSAMSKRFIARHDPSPAKEKRASPREAQPLFFFLYLLHASVIFFTTRNVRVAIGNLIMFIFNYTCDSNVGNKPSLGAVMASEKRFRSIKRISEKAHHCSHSLHPDKAAPPCPHFLMA